MSLRSKNFRAIGECRFNSSYLRFGYGGNSDANLTRAFIKVKKVQYQREDGGTRDLYIFANENGLQEEMPSQGLEVKMVFDHAQKKSIVTHIVIRDKLIGIDDLLKSQVISCNRRLEQGEDPGFISYPEVLNLMPYLEWRKKIPEIVNFDAIEKRRKDKLRVIRNGGFQYGSTPKDDFLKF